MKFKQLREKMSGSKLTGQEISVWYRKNKDVDKAARKDKNIKKAVEIALDHGGAMNFAIKKIEKIKRGLADNPHVAKALSFANFGEDKDTISEGTWAIPDSYEKMQKLQNLYLAKKMPGTKSNAKKFADKLYSLFGDDSFFDDLLRIEMKPDPKVDLRDILVKHLEDWNMKFKKAGSEIMITHAPKSWWEKEEVEETAKKRKSGNIRPTGLGSPMKGKLMAEGVGKMDPMDKAERILNYKIKELQYKTALKTFNEYDADPEVKKENSELNERGWKPESPAAFDKTMKDKKLQKDIAKFFDTDRHEFMTVKDAEKKFPYMIKYMKNSEFLKINKEKLTDKNLMMVATTMSDD